MDTSSVDMIKFVRGYSFIEIVEFISKRFSEYNNNLSEIERVFGKGRSAFQRHKEVCTFCYLKGLFNASYFKMVDNLGENLDVVIKIFKSEINFKSEDDRVKWKSPKGSKIFVPLYKLDSNTQKELLSKVLNSDYTLKEMHEDAIKRKCSSKDKKPKKKQRTDF